jgi:hypothetical protein
MKGSVLSNREIVAVVEGLRGQGATVTNIAGERYKVTHGGHMVALSLGTSDRQQLMGAIAKVRRLSLRWPLDRESAPKPKQTSTAAGDIDPAAVEAARIRAEQAEAALAADRTGAPSPTIKGAESLNTTQQSIELVTPEVAEKWLETMAHNRKLSSRNVSYLARQMRDGLWVFDGSPIRFNDDGELVDGQHRLWALIEAEYSAEFLVIRGLSNQAMPTMDTGKSRSFADILAISDSSLVDVNNLSGVTGVIYRWEDGQRGSKLTPGGSNPLDRATNAELLEFFNANKDRIIEVAKRAKNISSAIRGLTTATVGCALWTFEAIDAADAEVFFERLRDGIGLDNGNAILALRQYLIRVVSTSASRRSSVPLDLGVALLIKAWNAWREGHMVQQISYRRGGRSPEQFPEPV